MLIWFSIFIFIIALGLYYFAHQILKQKGFSEGEIVFTDIDKWEKKKFTLYDKNYQLCGRPDYIRKMDDEFIPVEVKTTERINKPHAAHILQLMAYCYLVEQTFSIHPTYGELHYPDKIFQIPFTTENQQELIDTLQMMRRRLKGRSVNREHNSFKKCTHCGFRDICDQKIKSIKSLH